MSWASIVKKSSEDKMKDTNPVPQSELPCLTTGKKTLKLVPLKPTLKQSDDTDKNEVSENTEKEQVSQAEDDFMNVSSNTTETSKRTTKETTRETTQQKMANLFQKACHGQEQTTNTRYNIEGKTTLEKYQNRRPNPVHHDKRTGYRFLQLRYNKRQQEMEHKHNSTKQNQRPKPKTKGHEPMTYWDGIVVKEARVKKEFDVRDSPAVSEKKLKYLEKQKQEEDMKNELDEVPVNTHQMLSKKQKDDVYWIDPKRR